MDNTGMFQFLLSGACTEPRSSVLLTTEGAGGAQGWEGTQLGQPIPTDQRHLTQEGEVGMLAVMVFVFPGHAALDGALHSCTELNHGQR